MEILLAEKYNGVKIATAIKTAAVHTNRIGIRGG
jgi:hypothetical protein